MKKIKIIFLGYISCCMSLMATNIELRYPIIPKPIELIPLSGEFIINERTLVFFDLPQSEAIDVINALTSAVHEVADIELKYATKRTVRNTIKFTRDSQIVKDEGYTLNINKKGVFIGYKTLHGAFNAVQTLRQLMPVTSCVKPEISVPAVAIKDYPMLSYRGYLLDVGRYFYPVDYIKKTLDFLSFYKINVFHFHLTEDQGWRIEIKKYPRLHEVGAWRSETQRGHRLDIPRIWDGKPHGGYYTQEELKDIVKYAKERFIRVIPEIDIPGHSQAILAAYPQYGCLPDTTYTVSTYWGVHDNILCPTDKTFSFLQDVFDEVMDIFPDKNIHIGGDEVPKRRWKQSPYCQELIKKMGLKDEKELQSYFICRIEKYLNGKGRQIIGWDEILEGGLAPQTTVMSWRGEKGGIEAAKQKRNVIMTPSAFMYINFYNSSKKNSVEPLANSHVLPLSKVYNYDPFPKALNDDEKQYIIGLQASLWTEYCSTQDNAESLTFPRLCAMAEAAWLPIEMKNYDDFYKRLLTNIKHLDRWKINYSKLFLDPKNN